MATNVEHSQWQCGKSLSECLGYILDNEKSCDVTFVVGEQKVQVGAHKTILTSRSPVFDAMLNGPWTEKTNISIPDIEHEIFKQVLRYMYTDKTALQKEDVLPVLYVAKKYSLDGLSQKCVEFCDSLITEENAFIFYEQAHLFDDQNLEDKCMEQIKRNPKKCLESPSFLELSRSCCEKIVSSDCLMVQEEIIYENVMRWSVAECSRKGLEISATNQRNVLGGILYKIRFPVLDKEYFTRELLNSDLLSSDEKLLVMKHHFSVADNSTCLFDTKRRIPVQFYERIVRFTGEYGGIWGYSRKQPDRIFFRVSKNAVLHGVVLYGDANNSKYSVDLSVKNNRNVTLSEIKTNYSATGPNFMSDIIFQTPVPITAGEFYKITAEISGPDSKAGNGGLETINTNNITISFMKILTRWSNGTTEKCGQIPGVLLSY